MGLQIIIQEGIIGQLSTKDIMVTDKTLRLTMHTLKNHKIHKNRVGMNMNSCMY